MSEDDVQTIVQKIDTLHRCLDEHIKSSTEWRQRIDTQLNEQDRRLDFIEHEATRTRQTVDNVDAAVKTAKTMKTLISWISAVTIGVVSTWWAIRAFINNESPL